jgi:hypothetical protein
MVIFRGGETMRENGRRRSNSGRGKKDPSDESPSEGVRSRGTGTDWI